MINLLCFADDMVLLAPSWSALQSLIDVLFTSADRINMKFNADKTVCMVFNPTVSRKIVAHNFFQFTAGNDKLEFVDRFKYLGNIITKDLRDDEDIEREIKCLFTRCNVLISRFKHCSWLVKLKLFRSYCSCFYNIALWCSYNKTSLRRFVSSYNKSVKRFFGYVKYSSMSDVFLQTCLPTGDTALFNCKFRFREELFSTCNKLAKMVV